MAEKPDNAKPRRRWYQFSLRTLLIGVTLLGACCSLATYVAHEYRIVAARKAWQVGREPPFPLEFALLPPTVINERNAAADPSLIRRLLGDQAKTLIEVNAEAKEDAAIAKALFPEAEIALLYSAEPVSDWGQYHYLPNRRPLPVEPNLSVR